MKTARITTHPAPPPHPLSLPRDFPSAPYRKCPSARPPPSFGQPPHQRVGARDTSRPPHPSSLPPPLAPTTSLSSLHGLLLPDAASRAASPGATVTVDGSLGARAPPPLPPLPILSAAAAAAAAAAGTSPSAGMRKKGACSSAPPGAPSPPPSSLGAHRTWERTETPKWTTLATPTTATAAAASENARCASVNDRSMRGPKGTGVAGGTGGGEDVEKRERQGRGKTPAGAGDERACRGDEDWPRRDRCRVGSGLHQR